MNIKQKVVNADQVKSPDYIYFVRTMNIKRKAINAYTKTGGQHQ
jgi:hypothetical protein